MLQLTPAECRVLGVLVEKAHTTPAQYPLSLNAITTGCNQKSNREPVVDYDDERVLRAIDRLRARGLVIEVSLTGSRVLKYRHNAREVLGIGTEPLVVLTELMLRGPQTVGELRGRASRMHALESTDTVRTVLAGMSGGEHPMVRALPPEPGGRAGRFAQLLCPDLHPIAARETPPAPVPAPSAPALAPAAAVTSADVAVAARVDRLEREVAQLRAVLDRLARSLGRPDVLG